MNEADKKRELVKQVKLLGGQARRVEDSWAVGVLDLAIKLPERPFVWAEGKIIKGNVFAPTGAQFAEGEKWIKAGVGAVLIGWEGKTMYISPWTKKADKRECWMWTAEMGNFAEMLSTYLRDVPADFIQRMPHAEETESRDSA